MASLLITYHIYSSMASKLTAVDKRVSPPPNSYNIPSKIVEKDGKTFGLKLKGLTTTDKLTPGPGTYAQEKAKRADLQYSMAQKLGDSKGLLVPGPGAYNTANRAEVVFDAAKQTKIGTGDRSKMELPQARAVPGAGEHSPDYRFLKTASPRFGFGT